MAAVLVVSVFAPLGRAQHVAADRDVDKWLTVTGSAAGMNENAKDEAVNQALRKAVEQACGVFLTGESKAQDYQLVYDKVFADAVGYVREHKVEDTWLQNGQTNVRVRARVSTKKFEKDWATIRHTLHQEGNPRVIIIVGETTQEMLNTLAEETESSSASMTESTVDATATVSAAEVAEAQRLGEAYVWTDAGGRRWRRRGTTVECISREQVTAAHIATAEAHFRALQRQVSASQSNNSRKIWTSVATALAEKGVVQGEIEEFFLSKGVKLMDRSTTEKISKRDLMLAMAKDDIAEVTALGARFKADVIIFGTAAAQYSREVRIGDAVLHQYTAKLVIRAIRTDSGQLLVSKVFGPFTVNSTLRSGGEQGALEKLGSEAAPKLLAAIVEAWRQQSHVSRDISLQITGMDFSAWKLLRDELKEVRGVQALRLREITESVANVDVEWAYKTENLADRITELKTVKLEVVEISPNRIKLKMVK
ncbi:MAG TPA: hypothetical protein DCX07_16000 [Phycisphaerales bacterium]|nr:hypothetical protein [Phycisphaerales bacterium]